MEFIDNLGRRIVLFEIIGLASALLYLGFPLLSYYIYNKYNELARIWGTFMPVDSITYYSLALPGTILFIIGLNITANRQKLKDDVLIANCKLFLTTRKHIGYIFILIGILSSGVGSYFPATVQGILYYFSQLTYIGFLYLLHSKVQFKILILIVVLTMLIVQTVITGMYGELVYWSVLGGIILLIRESQISFWSKLSWLILGIWFVFIIQSIKHEYRSVIWETNISKGNAGYFLSLIKERITNPLVVFDQRRIFGLVTRGNQGFLVARTMAYVPKHEPFAYGETLILDIAASLAPRIIWKNKPEVGGVVNTCRFLGDCQKRKYSYNIGQLGESYVNFGTWGGALVMFFYGWFIRWSYVVVLNIARRKPTLVLWIPLLFFMSVSLEIDFLTYLNSFFKAVFFAMACYIGFWFVFKIRV